MKKSLTIILAVCLLAGLCACGGSGGPAEPQGTQAPQEVEPSPEPTATPEPTAAPTPEPVPAAGQMVITMDYGRLYAVSPIGGDATLLADKYTLAKDQWGDILWAAFDDGEIRRYDLAAGTQETLDMAPLPNLSRLEAFDGGFFAECTAMADLPTYWVYREATGSAVEFSAEEYLSQLNVVDGMAVYVSYHDDSPWLRSLDLDTGATLWEVQIGYDVNICATADGLYVLDPDAGTLHRLDTAAQSLEQLSVPIRWSDMDVLYGRDGVYLIQGGYDDHGNLYLIRDGQRKRPDVPGRDGDNSLWVDGSQGDTLLLREYRYQQSQAVPDLWYDADRFYVLHPDTGTVMPVKIRSEYNSLFADGDFPVMDSSTARKPLVDQIYTFFCESTGAGGSVPLCSTTHGAWTNMADRTVDVALLAAPTQEERDYLDSQGVEVEMKLYGGDGLVFIGSGVCGVTDLTLDQVRSIYRGEVTNWAQLGGADAPITVLYRDDQSGSQRLFEQLIWGEEPVPDLENMGFTRLDEMSTIVTQCLQDPYAIGYSIMTYLNNVYAQEDLLAFSLEGVAPTAESVAAQTYPLATRGYVVIRADEPQDSPARRLFDWFGSPLSDYILSRNDVTPLSE